MTSGITVSDECKARYDLVKMTKAGYEKFDYAVFKIADDEKSVVLDEDLTQAHGETLAKVGGTGDDKATIPARQDRFFEVVKSLPENACRYMIFDYPFLSKEELFKKKIVFVCWNPEGAPVKAKMIFASTKSALKNTLEDVTEIQAGCKDDLSTEEVVSKLKQRN